MSREARTSPGSAQTVEGGSGLATQGAGVLLLLMLQDGAKVARRGFPSLSWRAGRVGALNGTKHFHQGPEIVAGRRSSRSLVSGF